MTTLLGISLDFNMQSGLGNNSFDLSNSDKLMHLAETSGTSPPTSSPSKVMPLEDMHLNDVQVVSPKLPTTLELAIARGVVVCATSGASNTQPADPHPSLQSTRRVR